MMEFVMTTDLAAALPAEIGFNFAELEAELQERLHHYNNLVVTEDAIREAKDDLAKLRKLRDAMETRRKDVKKQCERPYKAFEAKVKQLTALIDAPIAAIDSQVKTFEAQEKEKKRSEIADAYATIIPENLQDIVPLDRILDPRWLNKSTTMKSITEALTQIAKRANVDMALMSGVDPKYIAAVRAKYIETLDITTALDHQDQLREAEEAFRRKEEERARQQQAAQVTQPAAAQEPAMEPAPQPSAGAKLYALRLEFHLTMAQANALKTFLRETNINYTKI